MAKYAIQIIGVVSSTSFMILALSRGNSVGACIQALILGYFVHRIVETRRKAKDETENKG